MSAALLAFDTSTDAMAVALQWPGGELTWNGPGGAQASAELLPRIRRSLVQAGLECRDLDAIACGRGPGAFTGLRTACAVAQGLAFGAAKPVLLIDSLLIVAEDACAGGSDGASPGPSGEPQEAALEVGVVMDARMGEVYAARYERDAWGGGLGPMGRRAASPGSSPASWRVLDAPALCDPADLPGLWGRRPVQLRGSGLHLTSWAHRETDRQTVDRAAALLRLARQAWDQGQGVEAAQALPLYLRDKVALTTAERAAARQTAGTGPAAP